MVLVLLTGFKAISFSSTLSPRVMAMLATTVRLLGVTDLATISSSCSRTPSHNRIWLILSPLLLIGDTCSTVGLGGASVFYNYCINFSFGTSAAFRYQSSESLGMNFKFLGGQ